MRVDLPVYVERVKVTGGHRYVAFPLFLAEPHVAHENLNRALSKLGQKVLQELLALRRQNRQDVFAAYTFAPPIRDHFIAVDTSYRNKTYRGRLLFAEFPALGGRAAFAPCLPGLWFRVERGRAFEAQATDLVCAPPAFGPHPRAPGRLRGRGPLVDQPVCLPRARFRHRAGPGSLC